MFLSEICQSRLVKSKAKSTEQTTLYRYPRQGLNSRPERLIVRFLFAQSPLFEGAGQAVYKKRSGRLEEVADGEFKAARLLVVEGRERQA